MTDPYVTTRTSCRDFNANHGRCSSVSARSAARRFSRPVHGATRHHRGQRRAAADSSRTAHHAVRPAMGERRLRAELQQPDAGRGRTGRPVRPQARLHPRPGGLRAGFAAVRLVSLSGLAERGARGAGRGRRGFVAQLPGHTATGLRRCAPAGAGHRPVGGYFRSGAGGRADLGRGAGRCAGLAGDLLDQSAGRAGGFAADRPLRARISRGHSAEAGRGRAGAGHGELGRLAVRPDRRPCAGLGRTAHPAGWRRHRVGRRALCLVGGPRDSAADSADLLPPSCVYRRQCGGGLDELRRHGHAVRHEFVLPARARLVGGAGRGAAERDVSALRGAGVVRRAAGGAVRRALDICRRVGADGGRLSRLGAC